MNAKDTTLDAEALSYHSEPRPGKIGIVPTKPHTTQHDLALAYSPGVAAPSRAIAAAPDDIYRYTGRGNLVAVISNGTAVLGLGNIGAAAAKPVMEGKAMLFKTFAGLDAFDIEVDTTDPDDFVRTVRNIATTFGGINLEDIKAPECFEIEARLRRELDIPVMHDDQHGTAIIAAAALMNGIPTPALTSALNYFDGYRTERLPANLLQAQRDYFGAHTYERLDQPRGQFFHTNWTGEGGNTAASTYTV